MNTELHKRLNDAADKYALGMYDEAASRTGFIHGAEWLYAELFSEKPAVSSATINIRPTSEKMTAFKDTIKKKHHLSATDADLITGRVEMLLAEQRKDIVEQACEWLKSHKHVHSPERLGSVYFTNILTQSADLCDELREAVNH